MGVKEMHVRVWVWARVVVMSAAAMMAPAMTPAMMTAPVASSAVVDATPACYCQFR